MRMSAGDVKGRARDVTLEVLCVRDVSAISARERLCYMKGWTNLDDEFFSKHV